jgi:hypothetical protein
MIKEIRDYFVGQVRKVDSDLRFDGFTFETEKSSGNNIDYAYKLLIGESVTDRLDVMMRSIARVKVIIFKQSGTNRVEDFDKLYCKALAIHSKCSDQTQIKQDGFIKSVEPKGIIPDPFDSDENSVKITITFDVITYYSLED